MLAAIINYKGFTVFAAPVAVLVLMYRALVFCAVAAYIPITIIERTNAAAYLAFILCLWSSSASFHGYAPFQPLKIGGYLCFLLHYPALRPLVQCRFRAIIGQFSYCLACKGAAIWLRSTIY